MATSDTSHGPDFVQSLMRGLAVIRAFDAEHPRLTLSQVAQATGLSRAAARRSLLTLVHGGYVGVDDGVFTLRPRVLELGYAYLSSMSLPELAEPHLEQLATEAHESSSLSVLDGDDVVYVARVSTSRVMAVSINVGTRLPAYVTSMGRALLAGLPADELDAYLDRVVLRRLTAHTISSTEALRKNIDQVRAQGWSLVDGELEEGLRALAVPVRRRDGATVAAVNVSSHASRNSVNAIRRELLPPLMATVARIEADLDAYPSAGRRKFAGA